MHAGSIKTSRRLQQTLAVLSDGTLHTTEEIRKKTASEAVHSDIAALRANGVPISKALYLHESLTGARIYGYRLIPREKILRRTHV